MVIIRPLSETQLGNKYVLTITCCFTERIPLKSITAKAVASNFVGEFICPFGLLNSYSKEIQIDEVRQFESELLKEICVL